MRHDPLPDSFSLRSIGYLKIPAQHFDKRKIWSCLAVRDGRGFKHNPAWWQLMTSKFVYEARLTHTGLADHRQYLSATSDYSLDEFFEDFNFGVPADQGGQTAS